MVSRIPSKRLMGADYQQVMPSDTKINMPVSVIPMIEYI
jgi:hypothetical protein